MIDHRETAIGYKRSMDIIGLMVFLGVMSFSKGNALHESAYAKLRYHMAQDSCEY